MSPSTHRNSSAFMGPKSTITWKHFDLQMSHTPLLYTAKVMQSIPQDTLIPSEHQQTPVSQCIQVTKQWEPDHSMLVTLKVLIDFLLWEFPKTHGVILWISWSAGSLRSTKKEMEGMNCVLIQQKPLLMEHFVWGCNQISIKTWKLPLMIDSGGWRHGSELKSTDCSSRGPEFNSQEAHGG